MCVCVVIIFHTAHTHIRTLSHARAHTHNQGCSGRVKVGDAVWGFGRSGGMAEYAVRQEQYTR